MNNQISVHLHLTNVQPQLEDLGSTDGWSIRWCTLCVQLLRCVVWIMESEEQIDPHITHVWTLRLHLTGTCIQSAALKDRVGNQAKRIRNSIMCMKAGDKKMKLGGPASVLWVMTCRVAWVSDLLRALRRQKG